MTTDADLVKALRVIANEEKRLMKRMILKNGQSWGYCYITNNANGSRPHINIHTNKRCFTDSRGRRCITYVSAFSIDAAEKLIEEARPFAESKA